MHLHHLISPGGIALFFMAVEAVDLFIAQKTKISSHNLEKRLYELFFVSSVLLPWRRLTAYWATGQDRSPQAERHDPPVPHSGGHFWSTISGLEYGPKGNDELERSKILFSGLKEVRTWIYRVLVICYRNTGGQAHLSRGGLKWAYHRSFTLRHNFACKIALKAALCLCSRKQEEKAIKN